MSRLVKHWARFRSDHLATIALEEQLQSHEAAFFSGAWAAMLELADGAYPSELSERAVTDERRIVIAELVDEIHSRRGPT